MIPPVISKALKASPEGVRCCVAWAPGRFVESSQITGLSRGNAGTLELSSLSGRGKLMFTSDSYHRVHFKWHEWQGLHIPELGIFRA